MYLLLQQYDSSTAVELKLSKAAMRNAPFSASGRRYLASDFQLWETTLLSNLN